GLDTGNRRGKGFQERGDFFVASVVWILGGLLTTPHLHVLKVILDPLSNESRIVGACSLHSVLLSDWPSPSAGEITLRRARTRSRRAREALPCAGSPYKSAPGGTVPPK